MNYSSGSSINPSWFALDTSRDIETQTNKLFYARLVLLSDYVIYVRFCNSVWLTAIGKELLTFLLHGAILLIDFGLFLFARLAVVTAGTFFLLPPLAHHQSYLPIQRGHIRR